MGNASCDNSIINTFNESNTYHVYQFISNYSSPVNFHDCNSNIDVNIIIYDEFVNVISSPYCNDAYCGECHNNNSNVHSHNFMIPSIEDNTTYYILIESNSTGLYQVDIGCNPLWNPDILLPSGYSVNQVLPYRTRHFVSNIFCGSDVTSYSDNAVWHMYHLMFTTSYKLSFNVCQMMWQTTQIWHYNTQHYALKLLCDECETCSDDEITWHQDTSPIVESNQQYIFMIYQSNPHISVECSPAAARYKMVAGSTALTLSEAEYTCEQMFGTTLATIITEADMAEASNTIQSTLSTDSVNTKVWIGLYQDVTNDGWWQWVDGTSGDYIGGNDCMNKYWVKDDDINTEEDFLGTVLTFADETAVCDDISQNSPSIYSALCNAPNAQYLSVVTCNTSSESSDCFEEYAIVYIGDLFPLFAVWNYSVISVQIDQTNVVLSELRNGTAIELQSIVVVYTANYSSADINKTIAHHRAIQEESSFYIYFSYVADDKVTFEILWIDLQMREIKKFITIPLETSNHEDLCIAVGSTRLYVLGMSEMRIYILDEDKWMDESTHILNDIISICIVDSDEKFVYVFGLNQENLYKVDTESSSIIILDEPNLCSTAVGFGIKAANNKAYLYGCYFASWKTLIFNMDTETFDGVVALEDPSIEIEARRSIYSLTARMVIIGEIRLMLVYIQEFQGYSMMAYRHIISAIALNFKSVTNVWPSDGVVIEYTIDIDNDITLNWGNNDTNVWFYSNDTAAYVINQSFTLETTVNNCLYRDYGWLLLGKTVQCKQYFPLHEYLTLDDNVMDQLSIYITPVVLTMYIPIDEERKEYTPLIVSSEMLITFQRCIMAFEVMNSRSNSDDPLINMSYGISDNCKSRINQTFSLNLSVNTYVSSMTVARKQIMMTIHNNTNHLCKICNIDGNECEICFNDKFGIYHDILEEDDTLSVVLVSNSIDLSINNTQSSLSLEYFRQQESQDNSWKQLIIPIVIGLVLVTFVIICCFKKNRTLSKQLDIQKEYIHYISNPMVLSITIGTYDKEPTNSGIGNGRVADLNVDIDYKNIKQFCKLLNYDIYPKDIKLQWTQNELLHFIKEHTDIASTNMDSLNENIKSPNKKTNGYDSFILIVSGHGYKNSIITSDYQLLSKTALHRLISTNYPELRTLPRIVMFDVCDGDYERRGHLKEKGKHFAIDDINLERVNTSIWTLDEKNPDYKLVIINAANEGFQAKMNSIDGSYLLYNFIKNMLFNVVENKKQFLGDIVDGIQNDLHNAGKQQITAMFNNNTRYLMFKNNVTEISENDVDYKDDVDLRTMVLRIDEQKDSAETQGKVEKYVNSDHHMVQLVTMEPKISHHISNDQELEIMWSEVT